MKHMDYPSSHFNDAEMARSFLLRAFVIALGPLGNMRANRFILFCPRLQTFSIVNSYLLLKTR